MTRPFFSRISWKRDLRVFNGTLFFLVNPQIFRSAYALVSSRDFAAVLFGLPCPGHLFPRFSLRRFIFQGAFFLPSIYIIAYIPAFGSPPRSENIPMQAWPFKIFCYNPRNSSRKGPYCIYIIAHTYIMLSGPFPGKETTSFPSARPR